MRIVSNAVMRELDAKAINEIGIGSTVLMEIAGEAAAEIVAQTALERDHKGEILVFCGRGNNGGDGMVVARRLLSLGFKVRIFLMQPANEVSGSAKTQLEILQKLKARISVLDSGNTLKEFFRSTTGPYFVVDAILGTGLQRNIEGLYYDVIDLINEHSSETISLDISSGVMGDSGRIAGTAIQATKTVAFGFPRLGHFLFPGAMKRGKLYNVNLSFPREWSREGETFLLTLKNTAPLLQERDRFGHKNSFGHCLLVGGSPGRLGAIEMAGKSALKMGTGLVTVASWEDSFPSLEIKLSSEIMNIRIRKSGDKFEIPKPGFSLFSSVVVGPGLGQREDGGLLMRQLLSEYAGPLVIDADGLNLIGDHKLHDLVSRRPGPTVLTPHHGEMSRLIGWSKEEISDRPMDAIREAVERTGAVVLLKGATTLVHSPEGVTWLNHYPNDGMATAGSGDVLAGIIGGLMGQHMNALEATKLGVLLHSLSGRYAAERCGHRSMTALDIIEGIKDAFKELREHRAVRASHSCEVIV